MIKELEAEKAGYEAEQAELTEAKNINDSVVKSYEDQANKTREIILESKDNRTAAEDAELKMLKEDKKSKEQQENDLNKAIESTNEAPGPGSNQPGDNVATSEVEEAGNNATPEEKNDAKQKLLSFADEWGITELFDKKELGKMAVMYLGSRLFGYGHEGSANWAMKNYIQNTTAKKASRAQFIKSNAKNYTPASLEAYRKTGDLSTLIPVGQPVNATGEFKTVYKNGKPVQVQKYKVGDSYIWSRDGKTAVDSSYQFDAEQVKGSPEWNQRVAADTKSNIDVLKGLQEQFDKIPAKDQYGKATFSTQVNPALQGKKAAEWAIQNGVNAAQLGGLLESAYHEAIEYSKGTKTKVRDLVPFLNQQVIRTQTGTESLFQTREADKNQPATYVDQQKMKLVNDNILYKYQDKPGKPIDKLNLFWTEAAKMWSDLDAETRKTWERRATKGKTTGFYEYVINNVQ